MRHQYDLIVVGGGLSGLIAAAVASDKGKRLALLTKGAGTLTIGGGVIDVLGYVNGKTVNDPFEAMPTLATEHPYKLLGVDTVREALQYFEKLSEAAAYPFKHAAGNSFVPTAAGALKPSYLVPKCYDPQFIEKADKISVVGVEGMKDFYTELIIKGFAKRGIFKDKDISAVTLPSPFDHGRDISALDVARHVSTPDGWRWFYSNMKKLSSTAKAIIMPPILGTEPDMTEFDALQEELGLHIMETQIMPPSVSGLRIRKMLISKLMSNKVDVIEAAEVVRANVDAGRCSAVYTQSADRERSYSAKDFIIATGGFFGGGIVAEPGKAYESIFGIDLHAPTVQEDWSAAQLFGDKPHPFAYMGVKVNQELLPIDESGAVILKNVRFAGRSVGGYDFVTEKSGNGVALSTGYTAGRF